jgi:hypothetical protein
VEVIVMAEIVKEQGIGSVKTLEFDTLPREGRKDYIYLNDVIQGFKRYT